ncbi:MAG: ATP-dependent RNA helicase DbpA, partial [Campylobacterota bacterium]|nr:ATP-dependent RNA helicase DbpA [Campylobacterota bacterium]
MSQNFNLLPLAEKFLNNIASLGYEKMTTIQSLCIQPILDKNDVIVSSATGSGKSVAFGVPIVHTLDVKKFRVQTLVLAPTRELSSQVASTLRELSRHIPNVKILVLCGGVPKRPQINSLSHGAHIVVGTPGRVIDHLKNEHLKLDNVTNLVLDEADKMLNMGFIDDINEVISFLPSERQNMIFSATYPSEIKKLSSFMNSPKFIENIDSRPDIDEHFIESQNKLESLEALLSIVKSESILIFTNQKSKSEELADYLYDLGYHVEALHGDLEQYNRDEVLLLFANKSLNILVASDIVSRGIDISDVGCVINYEVPFKSEVYTHRIGRSARASKSGVSYTLVGFDDEKAFKDLEDYNNKTYELESITCRANYKVLKPQFGTIRIHSGKKHKMRAGDIVGALCKDDVVKFEEIGKIEVQPFYSYVAVKREIFDVALKHLKQYGI